MTRYLRATITLASQPQDARFLFTVDDEAVVFVNGTQVIDTKSLRDNDENAWQKAQVVDVATQLQAGANTIAVQIKNRLNPAAARRPRRLHRPPAGRRHDARRPAATGSRARPARRLAAARLRRLRLDGGARARHLRERAVGRQRQPPAAAQPVPAQGLHDRPSRSRRRACTSPRSACYEIRINGAQGRRRTCSRPAGRSTPSASSSQIYDVTGLAQAAATTRIGAILGEGWYAGRLAGRRASGARNPALRAQLQHQLHRRHHAAAIDAPTTRGRPAAAACAPTSIYDGETYDARLDQPGWDRPGLQRQRVAAARPSAPRRWPSSPPQATADHASSARCSPRPLTQPKPGHLHLRPRPELRRLGRGCRPAARPAPRSSCATARCSTRTARSTPPTCAPRCRPTRYTLAGTGGTRDLRAALHRSTATATSRSPASPAPRRSTRIDGPRGPAGLPELRHVHDVQLRW